MKEIEIKILEVDKKKLSKRLLSLGAKKVFDGQLLSLFFDYKDGRLKDSGNTLRIRKEGKESFLYLKSFISDSDVKTREELCVKVDDISAAENILGRLGLKPDGKLLKHRTSYSLGEVKVEFDRYLEEYSFVPEFLEIEGPDAETIFEVAKKLGYSKGDCKPWTFRQLVEHYKKI